MVVSVDPALSVNRSVSLLHVEGGAVVLSLAPSRASEFALADGQHVDLEEVVDRLAVSGVSLHDPDHLFYLTVRDQAPLRDESRGAETRQLSPTDRSLFEAFTDEAPEDDLDEAFVELDHWLVVGTFIGDKLVCAASGYPWGETRLADLGVITLPEFRGRGLGRATVRAMSAEVLRSGYEPQYRCQLDNAASAALARAAGFTRFGEWEVIDTDE